MIYECTKCGHNAVDIQMVSKKEWLCNYCREGMIKAPTDEEYRLFKGNHCKRIWAALSDDWRCPICDRTKRENMRWTKTTWDWKTGKQIGKQRNDTFDEKTGTWIFKKPILTFYDGWHTGFAHHHDHSAEYNSPDSRFDITLICESCNMADGFAKRVLKLPKNFSFAPEEIKEFITPKPHTKSHEIDYEKAKEVYERIVHLTECGWDWIFAKEKERREKGANLIIY